MFKKRKQNFRQRRKTDSGDEEEEEESAVTVPGLGSEKWVINLEPNESLPTKKPKKTGGKNGAAVTAESQTPSSVLSFVHDEEHVEEFKIKKSSRSERIARKLKKASKREKEEEIAAQKMKEELKRSSHHSHYASTRSPSPPSDHSDHNGRPGSDFDDDDERKDVEREPGHTFRSVLETGNIPDANMIHLARKRRQMAREMQDFIPIVETRNKINEKSRLVREENDDDEEDDTVPFSESAHHRARQRMRDDFLAAEHGSGESDSDKEVWEAQQIKKAMNIPQVVPSAGESALVASYVPAYPSTTAHMYSPSTGPSYRDLGFSASVGVPYQVASQGHVPPALSTVKTDWSVDDLCKRLHESLSTLTTVHRAHQAEKSRCDDDVRLNENVADDCEAAVGALEKRYRFFQQMRGYVRDLVQCHNEKLPAITELETSYLTLVKERATTRVKRRQQDIRDQAADYNPANQNKPGPPPATDTPRQRRAAEREARKGRRRRAREASNIIGHHEGLSTDDEETQSDLAKFNMERERIRQIRTSLYDDVLDEFCDMREMTKQFEEWKFEHGDSYQDAYIGLCLPKLFSPIVKLELSDWNPLEAACPSLERLAWFHGLVRYGQHGLSSPSEHDVDLKLVPSVIEKFVIPRLAVLADSAWDPMSKRETLLFVSLIEQLATEYPIGAESKNMQGLVKALVDRIKRCLDDDIFMPLYPRQTLENKFSPAAVFFSRQLWACIKLFRNALMWYKVISPAVLKQMTCGALLNRYILLGLNNSINNQLIARCQMIAESIPKAWFDEASEDSTIAELDKFCRFLVNIALNLERLSHGMPDGEAQEARERMKRILKFLVNLHAMDHAMEVAHHCQLKL